MERRGGGDLTAIDDLKRSLSLMFGDGKGNYPKGAYIDIFQIHSLMSMADVDAAYEGLDSPDPKAERIGVLAALVDYRDGTNLTGLNPKEPLGPPRDLAQSVLNRSGKRVVRLTWQTAYASDDPIEYYEILHEGQSVGKIPHQPQTTKKPFAYEKEVQESESLVYRVATVDRAGKRAVSDVAVEAKV